MVIMRFWKKEGRRDTMNTVLIILINHRKRVLPFSFDTKRDGSGNEDNKGMRTRQWWSRQADKLVSDKNFRSSEDSEEWKSEIEKAREA